MKNRFLRAQHWQLFVLSIVIPIIAFAIFFTFVFATILPIAPTRVRLAPSGFAPIFAFIPLLIIIGNFIQFYWMWSVGTGLQQYMHPEMSPLTVKRFKWFFFFPMIDLLLFALFFYVLMNSIPSNGDVPRNIVGIILLGLLLFFIHLFTIFCIIYTFYFVAKTINSAEMKQEAHFSDYIGDFFLIWLFPIGIWFIQPRILKLINNTDLNHHREELPDVI